MNGTTGGAQIRLAMSSRGMCDSTEARSVEAHRNAQGGRGRRGQLLDRVLRADGGVRPHPQLVPRHGGRCRHVDEDNGQGHQRPASAVAETWAVPLAKRHRRSVRASAASPAIGRIFTTVDRVDPFGPRLAPRAARVHR